MQNFSVLSAALQIINTIIAAPTAVLRVVLGSEDQELGNGFNRNIFLVLTWRQNILLSSQIFSDDVHI